MPNPILKSFSKLNIIFKCEIRTPQEIIFWIAVMKIKIAVYILYFIQTCLMKDLCKVGVSEKYDLIIFKFPESIIPLVVS